MCLVGHKKTVAKYDKVVYVLRMENVRGDGKISSPFQSDFKWTIGTIYTEPEGVWDGVNWEGFHSLTSRKDARTWKHNYWFQNPRAHPPGKSVIYKAIIPRGAAYIKGCTYNVGVEMNGFRGFVSDQLMLVEKIT